MSTTSNDRPTQILPTAGPAGPVRRSIFPKGTLPTSTAALPAVTLPTAAGADWRGQALTEELGAVPARALHRSPGRALLAAALLTGLQLYAAAGISDARQAALEQAALAPALPAGQSPSAPQTDWLIEGTTTAAPSPLDLPRCTTSPDPPLPCLATISPSQDRAVVLEEDASLTALARR